MSDNRIGLVEFINQLKQELLTEHADAEQPPLFLIDQIQVEMSVAATRSGEGGLKLYLLEVGGKVEAEHTQKVCVTLTPILDRETRIRLLDPKLSRAKREQIVWATVKGSTNEQIKELL